MHCYQIGFANLEFIIRSRNNLQIDDCLKTFMDSSGVQGVVRSIQIQIDDQYDDFPEKLPVLSDELISSRVLYHGKPAELTRAGSSGPAALFYQNRLDEYSCIINKRAYPFIGKTLLSVLRFIAFRDIFCENSIVFFHAAAIRTKGKMILFSAPSETGKTTHARLWEKELKAEIMCADRVLIYRENGSWICSNFIFDGTDAVNRNEKTPLGAVVLLSRGAENSVSRQKAASSLPNLLEQTIIDVHNETMKTDSLLHWMDILKDIPVYQLHCTPDKEAAFIMQRCLKNDGVI